MESKRVKITPEVVRTLASAAGLRLPAGRENELVPLVESILKDAVTLEEVDVTAHEPPAAFRYPPRNRDIR